MKVYINLNILRNLVIVLLFSYIFLYSSCNNHDSEQLENRNEEIQSLSKYWEKAIPNQEIPEGLESLSASECGDCHEEIYREWQKSNHAIALQDLQFQAEWAKDDSLWVCLNCHTPLQNQQESIILGKRGGDYFKPVKQANPHFDPELKEESITCAVCHVQDGAVIGMQGNQAESPHAVKKDPELLSYKYCLTCHNITDDLTSTLVCSFQSGDEWAKSPYPEAGRDCISCHMPDVYRPLTAGGAGRHTRRHTWIGSAIPKFHGEDKIVDGYKSGLDVAVYSSPEKIATEDSAFLTVSFTNQRAGHYIPTGDPEYFLTIDLRLADKNENTIKDTTFRIGQEWEWWPEARKLSDNRLKPLEQRNYIFAVKTPVVLENLYWEVVISSHRMTVENATFMGLMGKYPIKAIIYQRKIQLLRYD
jgi:hypothetical protein